MHIQGLWIRGGIGKTIGILGGGLDDKSFYPYENRRVFERIIENGGAVISEYPIYTQPKAYNFPYRNRLISALSDKIFVESSGTHATEITPIHSGTCHELTKNNIPHNKQRISKKFTRADYQRCDLIIGMDEENIYDIKKIAGGDPDNKVFMMMSFVGENRGVDDPYYTDDYSVTYKDISRACKALLEKLNQS